MAADLPLVGVESWQGHGTFAETNLRMLDDDLLCDQTFLAGELEEPVRAHRFMVVSRSPVFYAMFCGPVAEKQNTIAIPDVQPSILKTLLRYMYTNDCFICWNNVFDLLYAASKYLIYGLLEKCSEYLRSQLNIQNVCDILNQAVMFSMTNLTKCCKEVILKNSNEVLNSKGFLELSTPALRLAIAETRMTTEEEHIYSACVKWASFNCPLTGLETTDDNIRKYLGDTLGHISFLDMPIAIFSSRVGCRDILTPEEKVFIFRSIAEGSSDMNTIQSPYVSSWQQRSEKLLERFSKLSKSWRQHNKVDAVSFLCNKTVVLGGISLFAPSSPGETNGCLEILENNTVIYSTDVNLTFRYNKTLEKIKIRPRIKLLKDIIYTIRQKLQGEPTYYGSVTKCSTLFTYIKCISDNGTSDSEGQIHGLFIIEVI